MVVATRGTASNYLTRASPRTGAREISTTALYCYGVTWSETAAAQDRAGLAGERVEPLCFLDLAALTSPVRPGKVQARQADLLRHFDVLGAAFERGTVIPLRFGMVFDNEEALIDEFLEPRHDELARLLRELRERVELRVTGHYREEAIVAEIVKENPRIAHLRGQKSRALPIELGELVAADLHARTAADAWAIRERLGPLALGYEVTEEPVEYQVLCASFLVERKQVPAFGAAMDELTSTQAGRIDFKYVGPLPPHSFVVLERR
jgi:hypothetical protein